MGNSRVFLVGAGPGSAGMLTLRAIEVLALADVVIYDHLVSERLLDFARPTAERISVKELPGQHHEKYPLVTQNVIAAARAGKTVVRLKGGDPHIFGRGGEESEVLRAEGIPYEIVPGVTAGLGAAALLDISLTHRSHSSAVALVTGHEQPGKPGNHIDWPALARFPGTLVVYMGIARLGAWTAELIQNGKNPATPATIIEQAGTGSMRTVSSRLDRLDQDSQTANIRPPALVIVGETLVQKPEQSWFERLPLFGKRVLVTRPEAQSAGMIRELELLGAVPMNLPTVMIREPSDYGPLDQALAELHTWDWLVFTSANGVHAFIRRLKHHGRDLRSLARVQIACIGAKTAEVLSEYHLRADLVPESFWSEGLVESLRARVVGKRVLLARANRGRTLLRDELGKIATVNEVVVYDQVDEVNTSGAVFQALARGEADFLTFSSSNIARSLLKQFDDRMKQYCITGSMRIVAISPETARAIEELGYPVHGTATTFTSTGLIEAVVKLV